MASTLRYSTVSETPTGQTNQSKDRGPPSRKKSTLRSTFSKLFGRKKKKTTSDVSDMNRASAHISELERASQHRSVGHPSGPDYVIPGQALTSARQDPTALNRVKDGEPKRSTSLPITEFDRPLRSHSIGPDDMLALESARNSLQASRRRAHTVSRSYLAPRRDAEWGSGLSPRPANNHGRGAQVVPGGGSWRDWPRHHE